MKKYRGPLAAGLVLLLGTGLWAWSQKSAVQEREFAQLRRHADSLAKGLTIVAQRFDLNSESFTNDLRHELRTHLRLRRPFLFVLVLRGNEVLADEGPGVPRGRTPPEPGLSEDGHLFVVKMPLLKRPPPDRDRPPRDASTHHLPMAARPPPPDRASGETRRPPPERSPESPWDWDQVQLEDVEPLTMIIGFDPTVNPGAMRESILRTSFILLVAWVAIATLVLAWSWSIRSRDLRMALETERRERERLAEMSLAAAGLAHETRNPLGLILGVAQRLAAASDVDRTAREAAEQIMDAADRATARLSDFIHFARIPVPQVMEVSAVEVLNRVTSVLRPDFEEAGVRLALSVEDLRIHCDPTMLEQVIINLLLNSLQASQAGSTTRVRLERQGASAILVVMDEGLGITADLMPNIFKPYVSGRPDGHGLGLAIVKRIVEQHGWAVHVSSASKVGTSFTVAGIRVSAQTEQDG